MRFSTVLMTGLALAGLALAPGLLTAGCGDSEGAGGDTVVGDGGTAVGGGAGGGAVTGGTPDEGTEPGTGGADATGTTDDNPGGADAAGPVDNADVSGTEPEPSCVPNTVRCANPLAIESCDAFGEWNESACPEGFGCEDGQCLAQLCTPGASTGVCIDNDTYERCSDAGTAWETVHCGSAAYCQTGTCISQLCTPGTKICKGFIQLQQCNATGTAWVDAELCPEGGSCWQGECLTPCDVNIKDGSYLGCEYWAADLDNVGDAEDAVVGVVVTVPPNASATNVEITNHATGQVLSAAQLGVPSTYVYPGQLQVFQLPVGFDVDGTTLTDRTFRIVTTTPVAVHQFNPLNGEGVHTNDASLLLPSKVTGTEYYVMSWQHRSDNLGVLRGFATIIATQPGETLVFVTPTAAVAAGNGVAKLAAGSTFPFKLLQGQALNLETDDVHGADLTGTHIVADKKITVIGGHECANVPLGIDNCDHLEQQLFPAETWSFEYVADAFSHRSPTQVDIWRVIAGDHDVTVTTTPPVPGYETFVLQKGQWLQFASGSDFLVSADGPIMVGHYLSGSTYPGAQIACVSDSGHESAIGDPAFTLATPTKRYLSSYVVLTPSGYQQNFLNIMVRKNQTATVDGQPLTAALSPIPGTDYAVARQPVQPGVHTVEGTQPIGLTAYGWDCDVSYAYPGGMKLQAPKEE